MSCERCPGEDHEVRNTPGGTIHKDGAATCDECGDQYWHVPKKMMPGWVASGYRPIMQTFHTAAYLTHRGRKHGDMKKSAKRFTEEQKTRYGE